MTSRSSKRQTSDSTSTTPFPLAWQWLVDEALPTWVKQHYSPQASWKAKPFTHQDAVFFSKGIHELSEIFTEERGKLPTYFHHPRFRSAYLLYFVPLQAAKFVSLFHLYSAAMKAALQHGKKTGTLRIYDLGAGPGTGSIAALIWLIDLASKTGDPLPKIELHWWDTNASTMEDGRGIVDQLSESFPLLYEKIDLFTHEAPWWEVNLEKEPSLVIMGHVLNEATIPGKAQNIWQRLLGSLRGGGLLMVEPASRASSQSLSRLRDSFIESELIAESPSAIWGPCLHTGHCPLADGRDWCHFSLPVQIPGNWFRTFSKGLGSERNWVKFSYLWFSAKSNPAPVPQKMQRRVISDRLSAGKDGPADVLICEPEFPARFRVSARTAIHRGDLIYLTKDSPITRTSAPIDDSEE